jgi:L-rhamnose mutarotase
LSTPENLLFAYWEHHGDDWAADAKKMAADKRTQDWWAIQSDAGAARKPQGGRMVGRQPEKCFTTNDANAWGSLGEGAPRR